MSKIRVEFEFEADADGMDKAVALLKHADTLAAAPRTATTTGTLKGKQATPPPKGKAAAKGNSKTPPKEPDQMDIMDLAGPDEDEDQDDGGLGLGDDDTAEDTPGTAEEAKEEALAVLRTMLANGHKAHVKEVQQIMKVAKFHDVPAEQGFMFLKEVKKVQAKIGAK